METKESERIEAAKEAQPEIRRISQEEWLREGTELFGEDMRDWRFVCPNCKHVQTIYDFEELMELGIFEGDRTAVYFSCIGRYDTRIPDEEIGDIWNRKSPCNYTMGGLFSFVKTIVIDGDGKEHKVFEFDTAHEG